MQSSVSGRMISRCSAHHVQPSDHQPQAPGGDTARYVVEQLKVLMSCVAANHHWYRHHWLGVPIWQLPDDLVTLQEIVANLKPGLIVETGTKYGGTAVFFASLFQLLGLSHSRIVTIDIAETQEALLHLSDPRWSSLIAERLVGSSTDPVVVEAVFKHVDAFRQSTGGPCLLFLDDWHDGDHVFRELELYTPFLRRGDVLIVSDTIFADLAGSPVAPYDSLRSSNPRSALNRFIASSSAFEKYQLSTQGLSNFPDGIWRVIADCS